MHADGLLCAGHGVTRSFGKPPRRPDLKDEANVREEPPVESMSK